MKHLHLWEKRSKEDRKSINKYINRCVFLTIKFDK